MSDASTRRFHNFAAPMAKRPVPVPRSSTLVKLRRAPGPTAPQAQGGGFVMAGAEGQPRLDLDRDHAMRHPARIMRAIDEKAPGPHRRQALLTQLDPVLVGQGLDLHIPARDRG
jgi:hypothetical protein